MGTEDFERWTADARATVDTYEARVRHGMTPCAALALAAHDIRELADIAREQPDEQTRAVWRWLAGLDSNPPEPLAA